MESIYISSPPIDIITGIPFVGIELVLLRIPPLNIPLVITESFFAVLSIVGAEVIFTVLIGALFMLEVFEVALSDFVLLKLPLL